MNRLSICLLFVLGLVGAPQAFAACTPTEVEHRTFKDLDANTNGIKFGLGDKNVTFAITVTSGTWTATDVQFNQIAEFVAKNSGGPVKVGMFQLVDGAAGPAGVDVTASDSKLFVCKAGGAGGAAGALTQEEILPAKPSDCKAVVDGWLRNTYPGAKLVSAVLFNTAGVHCYSPPVIRGGDLLAVGMVLMPGEKLPKRTSVEFSNCPVESAVPEVLANGKMPELQSTTLSVAEGLPTVELLDARPCGGDAPVVTVKLGAGGSATSTPYTVNQYKRYRATFHMGALYTDLHDPTFGLRDDDGTNVITNTDAEERGPEYVAALVVQGIFNYRPFRKTKADDPTTWQYKGRDPIYDNNPADRFGLVLTTGLKDPGNRFGIGLSYEVAYGVNLVGIYEIAKVKQLRGPALGDPFTGAAADIPTRKEWEKKFSIGLTFDLAFASKLFAGAKSGG